LQGVLPDHEVRMTFLRLISRVVESCQKGIPTLHSAMAKVPCKVGDPVAEIDTPCLVVDLNALERNLRKLPTTLPPDCRDIRIRPHGKAHKCPSLAHLQETIGGCSGICAQTLSEAEAFVEGGINDVFVSNQVIGTKKLERLAALVENYKAKVSVCVDDVGNIQDMAQVLKSKGDDVKLGIIVEVNVGQERCGVEPGENALELAREVFKHKKLSFMGIQCYQGWNQHIRSPADRKAAVEKVVEQAKQTLRHFHDANVACPVVTGAGTGTYPFEAASGVFTEIQPGSYALMDVDYNKNLETESGFLSSVFEQSLFVLSTVQSVSQGKRAVVDCGMKGVSLDSGPPQVLNHSHIEYASGGDEHGILRPDPQLKVGDVVWLIPGHCDPTVNLHDWMIGIRDGKVETVWPITGRGPGV